MAILLNPFTGQLDITGSGGSVDSRVDDLIDLSGVPEGSTDLGTFTGTTIPDNSDNKEAFQALETAVENDAQNLADHISNITDAHDASAISNIPAGGISATNVQNAINELDTEKFNSADFNSTFDTRFATKTTADLTENTNLYFTDERAQDAVGSILTDSASVDFTYNDAGNSITAAVLPAGVDHNALQNYVANEHIDHSTVSISAGTGLTGGGDITTSRTISMPTVGTAGTYGSATQTSVITTDAQGRVSSASSTTIAIPSTQVTDFNEASQDAVGGILIDSNTIDFTYNDVTPSIVADVRTQMSITSDSSGLKLDGDATTPGNTKYYGTDGTGTKGYHSFPSVGSPGDIAETPFSAANNVVSPADVTGFLFSAASVRSFNALVSVEIDATSDLFEQFTLNGINKGGSFEMSQESVGDSSGVVFSITSGGQVQYVSDNSSGFVTNTIRFRATTTNF